MMDLLNRAVFVPVAAAGLMTLLAFTLPSERPVPFVKVAFLGNSITFVNDLPRMMEALSGGRIHQNSCLHGSLNFMTIMTKGNGMYSKWQSENALVEGVTENGYAVYDFGACSFPQLLFGYDAQLSVNNENDVYINDGKNPCIEDPVYLNYLNAQFEKDPNPVQWDYVVMNDQTQYPGIPRKRQRSVWVLKQVYSVMLLETKARPVLLATHGYFTNTTELGDVAEFTSHVYYGYQVYFDTLAENLPEEQAPLLAPVGLAFLTLHEENYGLWEKLFYEDGFHPSPHGTYLVACVLYATLYRAMPNTAYALLADMGLLWQRARRMEIKGSPPLPPPSREEANYLYHVAERVVLKGFIPNSLLDADTVEVLEGKYYGSTSDGDDDSYGEDSGG